MATEGGWDLGSGRFMGLSTALGAELLAWLLNLLLTSGYILSM